MNIKKAYERFKESEKIFRCPICNEQMEFINKNSLICLNSHCFDLSKYGYINFNPNHHENIYSKDMFESRRNIFKSGFYNLLIESIETLIQKYLWELPYLRILDVGCGEGYHSLSLLNSVSVQRDVFALDIVKDAVVLGAKGDNNIKWMVADLKNIPLKSYSMDLILNILTPANYTEFSRILKNCGILIKVIPGKHYLKEIRNCVAEQLQNKCYSNEATVRLLENNMTCLDKINLFYQQAVNEEDAKNFVKMTPLTSHVIIDNAILKSINQITIDIDIIICKSF